ncbi:unnamed protein product, partial [Adineta steineri]
TSYYVTFDRHRLLANQHSGFAHLIDIPFDNDSIHSFFGYGSSRDITPIQLVIEYTHYSLQQILQDLDYKHSSAAFLNILFDFITYSSDTDLLFINQAQFQPVP